MSDKAKNFKVTVRCPGHFDLAGVLNEHTNLSEVIARDGEIHLYMKGIDSINSVGTQHWMRHFTRIDGLAKMVLHEVSISFMSAISMIPTLIQPRFEMNSIKSFYIPYACCSCNLEQHLLSNFEELDVEDEEYYAPLKHCERCGNHASITEDSSEFFST